MPDTLKAIRGLVLAFGILLSVSLANLYAAEPQATFDGYRSAAFFLCFSRDSSKLAISANGIGEENFTLVDVHSGKKLAAGVGTQKDVYRLGIVAFTPDGKQLVGS